MNLPRSITKNDDNLLFFYVYNMYNRCVTIINISLFLSLNKFNVQK